MRSIILCDPKGSLHFHDRPNASKELPFKTRCTIQVKVCQVIIDSGSSENLVSKKLVSVLKVKTEPHPNPYKVSWIKKGEKLMSMRFALFLYQ